MGRREDLCTLEETGWIELRGVLERLSPQELERATLNPEGWVPKDVMFHVGAWQAEAGRQLERMIAGTYEEPNHDIDALNEEWLGLSRALDLKTVEAELCSSRTRLLQDFSSLREITPEAEEWFAESGHLHYRVHLPELDDWMRRNK
jgi:Mycothiol maleylpyruvate isomerase N-terminal domain